MAILINVILISANIAFGAAACSQLLEKMTDADIGVVLNKHNQLRALIATGQVPGQPRGVNVGDLKWDTALAAEAQKIAETCIYGHVKVNDPRFYVGQNIAQSTSSGKGGGADWNGIVEAWFNEHKNFKYPTTSNGVTGHYTQVVWADTKYLGCGYTYNLNNGSYEKLYVCNYGPGGNYEGQAPYRTS